ncbi:MAG: hypothetical protein O9311_16145, partial [Cytophagales bacterium]|nr:hypothetical protein [Cytophagales bacterium]
SEQAGFALKKKRRAMSKLLSFFFREIKKKVSISYFSICCVRNLRPPIKKREPSTKWLPEHEQNKFKL